jgi:uncharacterized coiled-coil protein SlyX
MDIDTAVVEQRLSALEHLTGRLNAMCGHLTELRRCVAQLQKQVAALEAAAGTRKPSTMAGWQSRRD